MASPLPLEEVGGREPLQDGWMCWLVVSLNGASGASLIGLLRGWLCF